MRVKNYSLIYMHNSEAKDYFIDTNGIKLHYIAYKGKGPLLH